MSPPPEDAAALASDLLEPGAAWPAQIDDAPALARALKNACYEAWSREPARAARAAEVLQQLAARPDAARPEVQGLADWTTGIACLTRGEMAQAVAVFDRAAAALTGAACLDEAAQTQVPKIMALSMLGRHDEAADCAEAAQRALLGLGNVRAAARVSLNIGGLLVRRDRYVDSIRHYREAAVLFARLGDHEHSIMADLGQAHGLRMQGDFDEAARIHARVRMRAASRGLELQLAQLDEAQALLDLAQGRFRAALAGLESARRRYEALHMPQCIAIAEKMLADAYLELRLLPESLALFDAAVARFAASGLPDEQAWALAQRGRAQALLGQASADASFGAAAALFTTQRNAVGSATVGLARSELALARGEADAALAGAAQSARDFEAAGQASGLALAQVLQAQGLLATGQAQPALALFEAVLARARALQQLQVQVRCLTGIGLARKALGEPAAAAQAFESAIELFEDQRRALPGDEIRSAFLTDHLRPYEEGLGMALQAADGKEDAGDAATVLLQLERFRARALDEQLAQGGRADPQTLDADTQALRERLNWLYHRFNRSPGAADESPLLREEMLRIEGDLLERARRQRLAAPQAAAGETAAWSVAALQAALRDGEALLEYGVHGDELFACVVTPRAVHLQRRLAHWPEVLEGVRAARFQLEALRDGSAHLQRHLGTLTARAEARLQRLHALLIAPLQGLLDGVHRLLIVPHGQLGAVPFAALQGPAGPLGQALQIALAPSARAALRGLLRPARAPHRVLALGESTRLPHAAAEAQGVARLFADGQALLGEAATLQGLRQACGDADVLHLACHAQFRIDNPRFSALHLHDGALTAELAEALPLAPGTVVLSACETALAESGGGDEMVGLVRAFLVAGAARVVASLWPVDDAVTAAFMAQFYGALVQGQPPALALQTAQCVTRQQHPHPCFWGAFTLYGGW